MSKRKKPAAFKRTLAKPQRRPNPFKQTAAAQKAAHPFIGEIRPSLLGGPISSKRRIY
jgi:hypothetical protein